MYSGQQTKKRWWQRTHVWFALIVALLYAGILSFRLGRDYLYDWDESIYAELGRELVARQDFLTPTWNDELWLEKPPLIAWMTALGMKLTGETALGARLFMPLVAAFTLWGVYRIGKQLSGEVAGWLSMGFLGYFDLFLSRARVVNTDGLLLAGIVWSVYFALIGSSPWLLALTLSLAVFAKGTAGVLALLIAAPLLITKPKRYFWRLIAYFLFLILPWHLYQYFVHGQAFYTPYLLEQVFRRATVPIEFHLESRWYYFQFLYQNLGLGMTLGILLGVGLLVWTLLKHRQPTRHHLVLWWLLVPLAIFTLAKTRLSWYILPVYPALALCLAEAMIATIRLNRRWLLIGTILTIGVIAEMFVHAWHYIEPSRAHSPLPALTEVATVLSKTPGNELAMLVSPSERVAQAILPAKQAISSSFRYGGAPAVVWYSRKHVRYYYNYDNFSRDVALGGPDSLIVSRADLSRVTGPYHVIIETTEYLGFQKENVYAQR
jgi:4-amino-4-deoxy-L-arabinose transferase-like glycosyltransferase